MWLAKHLREPEIWRISRILAHIVEFQASIDRTGCLRVFSIAARR